MRQRSKPLRLWALFDCLGRRGEGGETTVFTHLEVWAPDMFPAEAKPLPPAAFHPPAWHENLRTFEGCSLLSPTGLESAPWRPALSSKDADGRADQRGTAQLRDRCSALKLEARPLEWWAVPCVYITRGSHAGGGGFCSGGGQA